MDYIHQIFVFGHLFRECSKYYQLWRFGLILCFILKCCCMVGMIIPLGKGNIYKLWKLIFVVRHYILTFPLHIYEFLLKFISNLFFNIFHPILDLEWNSTAATSLRILAFCVYVNRILFWKSGNYFLSLNKQCLDRLAFYILGL